MENNSSSSSNNDNNNNDNNNNEKIKLCGLVLGPLHRSMLLTSLQKVTHQVPGSKSSPKHHHPFGPGRGRQLQPVALQQLPAAVQSPGSTASWCGVDWQIGSGGESHKQLFDSLFPFPYRTKQMPAEETSLQRERCWAFSL